MLTELSIHLDAFVASADEGSFSAAARRLGQTPAAISKSVGRLESRLGVRLFQRSTRSLALTTDGERLYSQVRLPWSEIGDALSDLRQGAGKPAGSLKASMAHAVGRNYLLPMLDDFVQRYPDIVLDLHFDNRPVDLVGEGFDVGIGGGIALSEGLIARELSRVRIVLVASPGYLRQYPAPATPAELARHRGLLRRSLTSGKVLAWTLRSSTGQEMLADVKPVAVLNDPEALARAAASGMGIALLPLPHALPYLDSGELLRVLPDWYAEALPLSIYYSTRKLLPAKVRVFVDYVLAQFRTSAYPERFNQP